jgi:hypothetical protein
VSRHLLFLLALAFGLAFGAVAARAAAPQDIPVVAIPGLTFDDLAVFAESGAVGLLVPSAGPETSEALARASIERAEARNSLRGGLPDGPRLIRLRAVDEVQGEPVIVVGIPQGGTQANDRRYPIGVFAPGYRGLLTSPSTRIAGVVSAVDVAPTARREDGKLGWQAESESLPRVIELDRRILDNGDARQPASVAAAAIVVLLALFRPRAAPVGVGTALAANLAVGIAGVSTPWVSVLLIAGAAALTGLLPGPLLRPFAVGAFCTAVVVAYLLAMGIDDSWVALSPLGPSQNARFFGVSNLLETMLLVPALAGAALLAGRIGPAAFALVAAVTFVAVTGSRFGADAGGAVVLAVGFAVLAGALSGGGRRAVVLGAAGLAVAFVLVVVDAALGPATHVGETLSGGPGELARDVVDRIELSVRRATSDVATGLGVAVGLAALVALALRLRGQPLAKVGLPLSFAAAIAASLIVNDSPLDVTLWGAAGLLALTAWAALDEDAPQLESSRSS